MTTPNPSGSITIGYDSISYTLPQQKGWRVPVSELRLIGEFTNDHGPTLDDYFFAFLTREEYFEASFYADGCEGVLAELSRRLQHELRAGLCNSTSLASRVLWPARLEGRRFSTLCQRSEQALFWAGSGNGWCPEFTCTSLTRCVESWNHGPKAKLFSLPLFVCISVHTAFVVISLV